MMITLRPCPILDSHFCRLGWESHYPALLYFRSGVRFTSFGAEGLISPAAVSGVGLRTAVFPDPRFQDFFRRSQTAELRTSARLSDFPLCLYLASCFVLSIEEHARLIAYMWMPRQSRRVGRESNRVKSICRGRYLYSGSGLINRFVIPSGVRRGSPRRQVQEPAFCRRNARSFGRRGGLRTTRPAY